MRLCVTADDYGLSARANAAIEDLSARGRLSAVAVATCAGAVLDGVSGLARAGVSLGVHLVLTQHAPRIGRAAGGLVGRDGRLPPSYRALFARLVARPSLRARAAAEIRAQLDAYAALGVPLAFVTGHEHVHAFPLLWAIVAEEVERLGVPGVRLALGQPVGFDAAGLLAGCSRLCVGLRPVRTSFVLSPLGTGFAGAMDEAAAERVLRRAAARAAPRGDQRARRDRRDRGDPSNRATNGAGGAHAASVLRRVAVWAALRADRSGRGDRDDGGHRGDPSDRAAHGAPEADAMKDALVTPELVVHPGHAPARVGGADEHAFLASNAFPRLLERLGAELLPSLDALADRAFSGRPEAAAPRAAA